MKVVDYSAAFASIRAIRGELLDERTIEEALNARSLEGVIDVLKKTYYGKEKALPYSREGLERTIKGSIVDIYTKVINFMPEKTKNFLTAAIRKFEIENIKRILTSKLLETPMISKESLIDLKGFTTIPLERLISARSFSETIEFLKKTPYGDYIKGKLPEERIETLFAIEMVLDYGFFRELIERNEGLESIDKDINSFYLGMQCDLINLEWIIRAKSFFGFSEERILSYSIPFGRYLNNSKIRELIRAKSFEDFLRPLHRTPWGEELKEVTDLKDPILDARLLKRFYRSVIKSPLIRKNIFSIGSFIELLCQKEMEIHDLTIIIESKIYDVPPETVRPLLLKVG